MNSIKIPCENCLILGMCKAEMMQARGTGFMEIIYIFMKCSLAEDYICQDGCPSSGSMNPTSPELRKEKIMDLKKYLGYYNELNRRDPM